MSVVLLWVVDECLEKRKTVETPQLDYQYKNGKVFVYKDRKKLLAIVSRECVEYIQKYVNLAYRDEDCRISRIVETPIGTFKVKISYRGYTVEPLSVDYGKLLNLTNHPLVSACACSSTSSSQFSIIPHGALKYVDEDVLAKLFVCSQLTSHCEFTFVEISRIKNVDFSTLAKKLEPCVELPVYTPVPVVWTTDEVEFYSHDGHYVFIKKKNGKPIKIDSNVCSDLEELIELAKKKFEEVKGGEVVEVVRA
jgi:hypothetical protein